jgi:hypothetical protein
MKIVRLKNALHPSLRQSKFLRQGTHTPATQSFSRGPASGQNDLLRKSVSHFHRAPAAWLVAKSLNPAGSKAPPPFADYVRPAPKLPGNQGVGQTVGGH